MRYILFITFLFFSVCKSGAQAYFSEQPIDNGSYEVPKQFAGTWTEEKYNDAGRSYTIVIDYNKTGHVSITQGMGGITPAILSKINGHTYLNLYENGGKEQPPGFYILLMEVKGDSGIRLTPLRYDLHVTQNNTLYDILSKPDLDIADITAGYSLWLTKSYSVLKKPIDTKGRQINIKKK